MLIPDGHGVVKAFCSVLAKGAFAHLDAFKRSMAHQRALSAIGRPGARAENNDKTASALLVKQQTLFKCTSRLPASVLRPAPPNEHSLQLPRTAPAHASIVTTMPMKSAITFLLFSRSRRSRNDGHLTPTSTTKPLNEQPWPPARLMPMKRTQ